MRTVKLYFADKPNKINQSLCKFIDVNLEKILTRGKIILDMQIATSDVIDNLKKRKIKRLPVLIHSDGNEVGLPRIRNYITSQVRNNKIPMQKKTDSELVNDYMWKSLGRVRQTDKGIVFDDDEDDDNIAGKALKDRFNEALSARKARDKNFGKGSVYMKSKKNTNSYKTTSSDPEDNVNTNRTQNISSGPSPLEVLNDLQRRGDTNEDDKLMRMFIERDEETQMP